MPKQKPEVWLTSKAQLRTYTPLVIQELESMETELGGRQQIVGMLSLAPLTPDLRYVLGMLGDPTHQQRSLAEICAMGNVLPGDLMRHLSKAALLRGQVRASQVIGQRIGAVVEDVMEQAAPHIAPCSGPCQGTGTIVPEATPDNPTRNPIPCPICRGSGKLTYPADREAQKLAIEMAHLLPKAGGINIAQINASEGKGGGGQGMLESLQQLSDRILYGSAAGAPPIDAEVAEPDPPPPDEA